MVTTDQIWRTRDEIAFIDGLGHFMYASSGFMPGTKKTTTERLVLLEKYIKSLDNGRGWDKDVDVERVAAHAVAVFERLSQEVTTPKPKRVRRDVVHDEPVKEAAPAQERGEGDG